MRRRQQQHTTFRALQRCAPCHHVINTFHLDPCRRYPRHALGVTPRARCVDTPGGGAADFDVLRTSRSRVSARRSPLPETSPVTCEVSAKHDSRTGRYCFPSFSGIQAVSSINRIIKSGSGMGIIYQAVQAADVADASVLNRRGGALSVPLSPCWPMQHDRGSGGGGGGSIRFGGGFYLIHVL